MTLPADATKVHMDAAADDPKQARAELADLVDKFNALIDHLQLSVITNDPLAIGQGIESDGSGNLRVKLDGATIARSASGIKVADAQLTTAKFANITANRVIGSSGAGVVGEVSASEGVQIASSVAKLDISGLTAETTVDTASDYIAMYDASAAAHRKVLVGGVAGIGVVSVQLKTTGTAATYTPTAGAKRIRVTVVGAGGDGDSALYGGGGGGGGAAIKWYDVTTGGPTGTYTVGTTSASTSSFTWNAVTISATGGTAGSSGVGAAGGTGTGGDINIAGGAGTNGDGSAMSGTGGSSIMGGGGAGGASHGAAGGLYGGGGGGRGGGGVGGGHADGCVFIEEFA